MPETRAHAAKSGRLAINSVRDRRSADANGDRKTLSRLLIVACVALLWMGAVFGRLGYLQLFLHSEYMARAQRQQQRVIEITPQRGAIFDRNMHPLAMSIPVHSAAAARRKGCGRGAESEGRVLPKGKSTHLSEARSRFACTGLRRSG